MSQENTPDPKAELASYERDFYSSWAAAQSLSDLLENSCESYEGLNINTLVNAIDVIAKSVDKMNDLFLGTAHLCKAMIEKHDNYFKLQDICNDMSKGAQNEQ